ncbi:4-carboxymuconolactone decarboxylase [Streptomyces uncialis]|uniref:bifunctional 3-oxoadipate enol-lactonase/4-carboxymuconolactone decarboxylase PcaDC n=1 Tax=Streptomyces uncialis TaxID=1048205 RepID=UPI0038074926
MTLHHRAEGPVDGPPLYLGPSLGTSLAVWDRQAAALARRHRVIRWDLPGHGGSSARPLPAALADLGHGVLDLAGSLGHDTFACAGISLGGAVGAWLAAHAPERVTALALVCASARFGEPGPWRERARLVRAEGPGSLAATAPARWFTPAFAASGDPAVAALSADQGGVDPEAYAACCDVLAEADLRPDLARITAPTLVVAGRDDRATPPAHARALTDAIAGSRLVELPRTAHLAPVEQPRIVLALLLDHFTTGEPAAGTRADTTATAMAVRRSVLGDAHVDRAVAGTTPFTARFQDLITRYAWGEIWSGGTLDRRTRSCITLTALVAGGHQDELAMHVRAALRNGLTPEEIGEVLLQTAVYCGVPAANSAFAVADRVLRETTEPLGENH